MVALKGKSHQQIIHETHLWVSLFNVSFCFLETNFQKCFFIFVFHILVCEILFSNAVCLIFVLLMIFKMFLCRVILHLRATVVTHAHTSTLPNTRTTRSNVGFRISHKDTWARQGRSQTWEFSICGRPLHLSATALPETRRSILRDCV